MLCTRKEQVWIHPPARATGKYSGKATVSANVVLLPLYAAPKDKTLGRETSSAVGRDTEWTRKYKDPTTGDQVGTSP